MSRAYKTHRQDQYCLGHIAKYRYLMRGLHWQPNHQIIQENQMAVTVQDTVKVHSSKYHAIYSRSGQHMVWLPLSTTKSQPTNHRSVQCKHTSQGRKAKAHSWITQVAPMLHMSKASYTKSQWVPVFLYHISYTIPTQFLQGYSWPQCLQSWALVLKPMSSPTQPLRKQF